MSNTHQLELTNNINKKKDPVQQWLDAVGFRFDPFVSLEASSDHRLSSYLVGHEPFSIAWGDWPSFVYAPAGGGKTALRAWIAQASWVGQETNRPFPIPYSVPYLHWGHIAPSPEDHLEAMLQDGSRYLLLTLAHRPHWFLRLDSESQNYVRTNLEWNLPGPLRSFLEPCRESRSLELLRSDFPPAFLLPDPPELSTLLSFFEAIEKTSSPPPAPSSAERWKGLMTALLDILGLPSVYFLLDGLDGIQETGINPARAVDCLAPLLPLVSTWANQRIYLKSFVPFETRSILEKDYVATIEISQSVTLEWSSALLAEVIRRRVFTASRGAYGSLGPLATPDLRDLETVLAREVLPLPREILVLTRRVLSETASDKESEKITIRDVEKAVRWYKINKPDRV